MLIKADFASEYGLHLHALPSSALSWWDFRDYLQGLLAADTRMARCFVTRAEEEVPGE